MMRQCPQKFLWSYGHPDHDLGAGMGKRKPLPDESQRSSEHHKLMGSVLSKVVEDLYNQELWRDPPNLLSKLEKIAEEEFERLEKRLYCLWTYMTREESLNICIEGAGNLLRIMKENRLLGQWNKSELRMTPNINKYVNACGIADLVFRNKEGEIFIYDGKNASTPGKYEDEDQLRWYALCFRIQYGVLPKNLGFFYFRYPSNNPPNNPVCEDKYKENWTGVIEVDCNLEDVKRLAKEAIDVSKAIYKGVFEANPVPKNCKFCDFEAVCSERQTQREENAKKRGLRKPKIPLKEISGFDETTF